MEEEVKSYGVAKEQYFVQIERRRSLSVSARENVDGRSPDDNDYADDKAPRPQVCGHGGGGERDKGV